MPRLLAFAGSARRDSFNRKLLTTLIAGASAAGAEVTRIDLRDWPLPLYDGDLEDEQGLPEAVVRLKALMREHDGLLLACPEYNGSITPLLKNTLDWCTRKQGDEPPLVCFRGKVAGLVSASPGALGGLRGLVVVRMLLGGLGVYLVPDQVAVGQAASAFDDDGRLLDPARRAAVERVGAATAELARRLQAGA
jgi:NAD(P)H-dependent FMN reductase